jgi:phycocyanobilin:ferredoxin oxidoreductase
MNSSHPLVGRIAESLLPLWKNLPEVEALPLEPALRAVRGELEGDEMAIDNELLRCRGLRKIHLEIAHIGRNLDILHCVMFPDPCYNLPIFGADIVAGRAGISAAIVDLSPTDSCLPPNINMQMEELKQRNYSQPREVPPWGTIFSSHVLFVRPVSLEEEDWFLADLLAFHRIFINNLLIVKPDPPHHPNCLKRYQGQLNYCQQQRRNDKTRRVLEAAFNPQWADDYIQNLLFDDPLPPGDQPCV